MELYPLFLGSSDDGIRCQFPCVLVYANFSAFAFPDFRLPELQRGVRQDPTNSQRRRLKVLNFDLVHHTQ